MIDKKETRRILLSARRRMITVGYVLWTLTFLFGLLGWIFWKWYAFPFAIIILHVIGCIYSFIQTGKIQRATGLTVSEQERLLELLDFEREELRKRNIEEGGIEEESTEDSNGI